MMLYGVVLVGLISAIAGQSCWNLGDNHSGCNNFVTRDLCRDPNSWEAKTCKKSCCQELGSSSMSSMGGCGSKTYQAGCDDWVKADPARCDNPTTFEALNCGKTCCERGRTSSFQTSNRGTGCGSLRDENSGCPGFVRDQGCGQGTYQAESCKKSCCLAGRNPGMSSVNTVNRGSFNTDSRSPAPGYCMMDYQPGTCPGGNRYENTQLMWYHCPYCLKCKQFRWSTCGGNQNRFSTQQECEQTCLRKGSSFSRRIEADGKYSNRRGACSGKVNLAEGQGYGCLGLVDRDPSRCNYPNWESINCEKACCLIGRNRRK